MKLKIVIGVFLGAVVLLIAFIAISKYFLTKSDPEILLNHLQKTESDKTSSLTVIRNGETLASVNGDTLLPLASTVKIIVAIEYAKQCESGKIHPDMKVSLEELDKFYIPKTDGGAHEAWIASSKEQKDIEKNRTTLENVAKGMIQFSSNANTEYLIDLLGLEEINNEIESLGIEKHEPLYQISSAMLIPTYLKEKNPNDTKEQLYKKILDMPQPEYVQLSAETFEKLKNGEKEGFIERLYTNKELQKIWSDRLPRSTTTEYASLMEKLNAKKYFSAEAQKRLDAIMEGLMENPHNQEWLTHAGQKGGSTLFVLTNAAYATDKKGNTTVIVFFANELDDITRIKLENNLNEFNLKLLTDEEFRMKLGEFNLQVLV